MNINLNTNFDLKQINNYSNIINDISNHFKIHEERLTIIKHININNFFEYNIDKNLLYLFSFENFNNINIKINNKLYNLITNGLFFENKNLFIQINSNNIENINLFIIEDIMTIEQKNIININNKITNNIFILNNYELITNNLCNELIKYIDNSENYNIEKWKQNTNVNCKYININDINDIIIKNNFDLQLFNIINWVINYLYKEYDIICTGDSGYCLRKIFGPTRLHKDGININIIDNRFLPIKKIRNMSIIICLNDDYDGGEFYFPSQNFKVKLKKGQIIVFPPYWTHPHMVSSPLNGTYRYTINTWLYQ
jgi:hypothetical protein